MQIQLPTSSAQLLDQVRVTREFTQNLDVEGGREHFPSFTVQAKFFREFNKAAELSRLNSLELALKSGVKSLQFN